MEQRRFYGAVLIVTAVLLTATAAVAGPRPTPAQKARHADRNKDGVVTPQEIRREKAWTREQRSKANTWWERRADTDNDGRVDPAELEAWKKVRKERLDLNNDGEIDARERRLSWRNARSRVNNWLESGYDANGDGWLEPAESRRLMEDRYALIKSKGKARVDTELEAEYDDNKDGIIDAKELVLMKQDLDLK